MQTRHCHQVKEASDERSAMIASLLAKLKVLQRCRTSCRFPCHMMIFSVAALQGHILTLCVKHDASRVIQVPCCTHRPSPYC